MGGGLELCAVMIFVINQSLKLRGLLPERYYMNLCMFLIVNGFFTGARSLPLDDLLHHMCFSWAWLLAHFMPLVFLNILRTVVCRI